MRFIENPRYKPLITHVMAADDEKSNSLESILNAATNPSLPEQDENLVKMFGQRVNKELEGPQIAVRLLAHKIQSPQENESLYALVVLERCVQNCGQRFHSEIGKFRFLNELIKVVSPKYLGHHMTNKVKTNVISTIFSWTKALKTEPKIVEAYQMLKKQGIVAKDPMDVPELVINTGISKFKKADFEDEEKAQTLARLLKSKNPDDLQAANRLIKNMVKQDAEKMDKVSKRITEIETVSNNIKLLEEMLSHYKPEASSKADTEIIKELFENLQQCRPNLFRLASDADEQDSKGIEQILFTNDQVVRVMGLYDSLFGKGVPEDSLLIADAPASSVGQPSDMDALGDIFNISNSDDNSFGLLNGSTCHSAITSALLTDVPLLPSASNPLDENPIISDKSLLAPALQPCNVASAQSNSSSAGRNISDSSPFSTLDDLDVLGKSLQQSDSATSAKLPLSELAKRNHNDSASTTKLPLNELLRRSQQNNSLNNSTLLPQQLENAKSISLPLDQLQNLNVYSSTSASTLDELVQINQSPSYLQPDNKKLFNVTGKNAPLVSTAPVADSPVVKEKVLPASMEDLFLSIDQIKPGAQAPLNIYEKNKLKLVLHFGHNQLRFDIMVMVLSAINSADSALSDFKFHARVSPGLLLKQLPPSGSVLAAYNPILPPSVITQVILIANPNKLHVKVNYELRFKERGIPQVEIGYFDI